MTFADNFASLNERSRFRGFSVLWSLLGSFAVMGATAFYFRRDIYHWLGLGGAEVAAEVIRSEALQRQVWIWIFEIWHSVDPHTPDTHTSSQIEESLVVMLQKASVDGEARKSLVSLLEKVVKDPAAERVVVAIVTVSRLPCLALPPPPPQLLVFVFKT